MVILKGDLCIAGIPEKKQKKIVRAFQRQRTVRNVFLIAAPLNENHLLEFFRSEEIKLPFRKKRDIIVYGLAGSEEDALELTANMVCSTYAATGTFLVTDYLNRRAKGEAGETT